MRDLFSSSSNSVRKDYSFAQLVRALRGLPAAMLTATSLSAATVKLPDDWQVHTLDYETDDGPKKARVTVIPADEPRGIVGFIPGWKTNVIDKIDAIEDIRQAGYSVAAMRLVPPGLQTGTLGDSLLRIKSFAFSKDSPLYMAFPDDLPRFVLTHSTSGMLFQHALVDARYQGVPLPPIAHALHAASFFDASGSSEEFHPLKNKLYKRHARRHFNELAGTPFMDRLYYYLRGISHLLFEEDPFHRPTHGQILEIAEYGRAYFDRKEQEIIAGASAITIPQTFYISTNDSFSCPHTATKAAKLEGAEIKLCKEDHDLLRAPAVRHSIIQRLNDLTEPREAPLFSAGTPYATYDLDDLTGEAHNDEGDLPDYQHA